MSDVEVKVIVEGKSELLFVNQILGPYFNNLNKKIRGILHGKDGGNQFSVAEKDIGTYLEEQNNTYISTMYDFYGIDLKWPGKQEVGQKPSLTTLQKVEIIENETQRAVIHYYPDYEVENRFIPYISMHEYEALLFSDEEKLAEGINVNRSIIQQITDQYNNPEEINDGEETAPSKRLELHCRSYPKSKPVKSIRIAKRIGIQTMRNTCPHFDAWLRRLENL